MNFVNKVILITGAGSGIGRTIALKFSKESAILSLTDKNDKTLNTTLLDCRKNGAEVNVIVADLCKDADIKKVVNKTIEKYKRIDVLINAAGMALREENKVIDMMEYYDKIMAVNLRAVVALTHQATPALLEAKGSVVNISSMMSVICLKGSTYVYSISKAALNHYTKCVARDLSPKGVRVNAVLPGYVQTDILKNNGSPDDVIEEYYKYAREVSLTKRIIDPDEIADLVLYLASDKAKSITGSLYSIDCGIALKSI